MSNELFDLMTMNDWIVWLIAFGGWAAVWGSVAGFTIASEREMLLSDLLIPLLFGVIWIVIYLAFIFLLLDPLFRALARG